jgi:glycosyltransferase involved in cell wall biosynthesis
VRFDNIDQQWNKHLRLNPSVIKQCQGVKSIDLLVGVLCKDVETTILNVLNVINNGLHKHFPDLKKAIVISEGSSTDDTAEAIDLFQPYNGIPKIVTKDITKGGKGAGILTIIEIAHKLEAKCLVLIDGDLLSIAPEWIRAISTPIIYGRADLTVPFYIRDKYDGVVTNNLVYPFTRAVYGLHVRQPIAGEFGLSKDLYEVLRRHPLFPPDFGADILIVTTAVAEQMMIREGLFALKIHRSTRRYLKPEEFLIPMFRKVTGCMLELAKYYEGFWKQRDSVQQKPRFREHFGQKPIPIKADAGKLIKTFKREFTSQKKMYQQVLPDEINSRLKRIVNNDYQFDAELWVKIVYHLAALYKRLEAGADKERLIDALKTLWIGRFASYAMETKDMDINEAENVIQRQANVFEEQFNYLKSIY